MRNMLMSRVHIKVTRKLIRESRPRCISLCAVAEAVRVVIREPTIPHTLPYRIMVSHESIVIQNHNAIYTFNTPKSASAFIKKYDAGRRCEPMGFYLYLPVQLLKPEFIK